MKKLFLCLFFLPVLIGCITDFAPEVEGVQGILVVDGMITSGESVASGSMNCCGIKK